MITWSKLLTQENFYKNPVPHYRIYNVLSSRDHAILYSEYFDVLQESCTGSSGSWRPGNFQQSKHWNAFLKTIWDSGTTLKTAWETQTPPSATLTDGDITDNILGVNLSCHSPVGGKPGSLIKDWHYDGENKKLSMIYYLGTGEEEHGNFEFKNAETQETLDYPYTYNSMTIWCNDTLSLHRFRRSNLTRKTVYSAWG